MAIDLDTLNLSEVESFPIKVLGGTFTVNEVVAEEGTPPEEAASKIKELPSERWFVLLAETGDSQKDTLALIDDDVEFLVFATGVFQGE